jgi:hypothetical protein
MGQLGKTSVGQALVEAVSPLYHDLTERLTDAARRASRPAGAERLAEWMASDLSKLDLLIIQIDGLHIGNDLVLVAGARHRWERR